MVTGETFEAESGKRLRQHSRSNLEPEQERLVHTLHPASGESRREEPRVGLQMKSAGGRRLLLRVLRTSNRLIVAAPAGETDTPLSSATMSPRFGVIVWVTVPVGVKRLWHKSDGRHAKLRLALTSDMALDTELLEAGKMSSCEKGRSCQFLMFRIPCKEPGTMKCTKINLFEGKKFFGKKDLGNR